LKAMCRAFSPWGPSWCVFLGLRPRLVCGAPLALELGDGRRVYVPPIAMRWMGHPAGSVNWVKAVELRSIPHAPPHQQSWRGPRPVAARRGWGTRIELMLAERREQLGWRGIFRGPSTA
jgi:hypothetical protein